MINSGKFEIWSFGRKTEFAVAFAKGFNSEYGTNFAVFEESFEDAQDYDFRLRDIKTKEVLKVQHTYAGADEKSEYVRPNNIKETVNLLLEKLADFKELVLSINFSNPPETDTEKQKVADLLAAIVVNNGHYRHPVLYRYNNENHIYGDLIGKYLKSFEIIPHKGLNRVGVMYSFGATSAMLDNERVDIAVARKEEHYANPEDIVLIVDCNKVSFFDITTLAIRLGQQNRKFFGIWIYDGWADDDRFIKIK